MPIDFGEIVISPAMDFFALPMTVTPVRSQPRMPPYSARGIWSQRYLAIALENGAMLSTSTLKISIYAGDPSYVSGTPVQGDEILITLPDGSPVDLVIDNVEPDGQGGLDLIMKFLRYPEIKAVS